MSDDYDSNTSTSDNDSSSCDPMGYYIAGNSSWDDDRSDQSSHDMHGDNDHN